MENLIFDPKLLLRSPSIETQPSNEREREMAGLGEVGSRYRVLRKGKNSPKIFDFFVFPA